MNHTALLQIAACAGGLCLLAAPAVAQAPTPIEEPGNRGISATALQLFDDVVEGSIFEVQLGHVAQQRAQTQRVKDFALTMAREHGQLLDGLHTLAQDESIPLPSAMKDKQKETIDRLSRLSGRAFDQAYMTVMVRDHAQDVAMFENELTDVENPRMQQWATDTMHQLRGHLEIARTTAKFVGVDVAKAENSGRQQAQDRLRERAD